MATPSKKKTYLALTLDPVHIGTGGYRLGRVDNSITREPGTNIPKIPGSSISGAVRAYTAMAIQSQLDEDPIEKKDEGWILDEGRYKKMKFQRPVYKKSKSIDKDISVVALDKDGSPQIERDKDEKEIYHSCAGKGADDGDGHCGERDCPVCIAFGFSKGKSNISFQGLVQFYDARILFFPVHSMIGPVWITCPSVLKNFGLECSVDKEKFSPLTSQNKTANQQLNFGWLMLDFDPNGQADSKLAGLQPFTSLGQENMAIMERAYIVHDALFPRLVNDNLEVRTSVAIDPATGAAEDGALYTYEAIPRAAVMWFEVIYNNPDYFRVNGQKICLEPPPNYADPLKDEKIGKQAPYMAFNVEKGFEYLETLGIGGMNTRGMGRMKIY